MPITSLDQLSKHLNLTEAELSWKEGPISVPLCITEHYLALIDPKDPNDPLRRQVVPTCNENLVTDAESNDPLQEVSHSHGERLVHRYMNRVAFLATDLCPMYCRHCFRRRFTGNMVGPASEDDIQKAAAYLRENPQVKEMLVTGGDPLTLSDSQLDHMIGVFRDASPRLIIRICTRYPVSQPSRITKVLVDMLKSHNTAPFYLMTQFNHPRELTQESIKAVSLFIDAGIPAMNQSVLLRGVNDDADTLERLCNDLLFNRIKPYYLFQGDMVSGTSYFRVPLRRGMEIERELRVRLSGLGMPNYVSDLPDGGGKVPLCGSYILESPDKEKGSWKFRTPEGGIRVLTDPLD
ncbi:MAG: KamA family radical SAM protein [Spirochaetales bacterium]|nr:KamA family radical SAM protein [Spirochaetales bacterium]